MHHDQIALGDAGVVRFHIEPAGITLDELIVSPGWQVTNQQPKGMFGRRRRKPADVLIVVLRQGRQQDTAEWELEIAELDDGSWEHAILEKWSQDPETPIPTPAGEVCTRNRGGVLSLEAADPQDGWSVRHETHTGDEVVVVFSRGTEDWEVVVQVDHTGEEPPVIEREHRWRIR